MQSTAYIFYQIYHNFLCWSIELISFQVTKHMKQPIFVYYELDNFYQNHRRYAVFKICWQIDNHLNLYPLAQIDSYHFPDVYELSFAIVMLF